MKNSIKTITAIALTALMLAISPMTDLSQSLTGATTGAKAATIAKAAETPGGPLYLADVKTGNAYYDDDGPSEAETVAALEAEGYTVLKDGSDYADLNVGNETSSVKEGPSQKKVLLGYKTTTDPAEAITDLAVMNMEGGYSTDDYDALLATTMESKIKPFMEKFVAVLYEYRENLKKPKDSAGYIRADFCRQMLNKITDDDTGGKPLGDLLLNETKFEMSDADYDKLSDSEKKEHADILTILMQGNESVLQNLESLLARATDATDTTWIDRLKETELSDLQDEIMDEKPNLTKSEVNAELDKRYQDGAKAILEKWSDLAGALKDLDEAQEILDNYDEENYIEAVEALDEAASDDVSDEEKQEAIENVLDEQIELTRVADAEATVNVSEFLDENDYDFKVGKQSGSTLLDFFSKDAVLFSGTDIRNLYPVVASLTAGQLAALEFLSAKDLVTIGMNKLDSFKEADMSNIETISVYTDVNREIYSPGGVGLTSEASRKQKAENEQFRDLGLSGVSWGLIAGASACAVFAAGFFVASALTVTKNQLKTITIKTAEGTQKTKQFVSETTKKYPNASAVGWCLAGVTLGLIVADIILTIADLREKYRTDYTPIPKYMVDEVDVVTYNEKGERILMKNQTAYYEVALCINRIKGESHQEHDNYAMLLDRSDLNGDIGAQWLALYKAKNKNGSPILADSLLYVKDDKNVPDGYSTGIHEFGGKAAMNLNKKVYLLCDKDDDRPTVHVYYKNAENTVSSLLAVKNGGGENKDPGAAGSIFAGESPGSSVVLGGNGGSGISFGSLALGIAIGIVLGGILSAILLYFSNRRKISVVKDEEKKE